VRANAVYGKELTANGPCNARRIPGKRMRKESR